jgi:predicted nucleic acid-binding protein
MIVVDTNILVYFHIQGDFTGKATQAYQKEGEWTAPYLWRSEFRNTLLLYLRKNILSLPYLMQITQAAESMMLGKEFHVITDDVYRLASLSSCSAYDCEFVALAQDLGVPLVTVDKKLLHEFPNTAVSLDQFLAS